jgi:hypothetical protein
MDGDDDGDAVDMDTGCVLSEQAGLRIRVL